MLMARLVFAAVMGLLAALQAYAPRTARVNEGGGAPIWHGRKGFRGVPLEH